MAKKSVKPAKSESKPKRRRSPNYPGVSLKDAVGRVGALYNADGPAGAPSNVALKHFGFSKEHGRARVVVSALKKFGLIEAERNRVRPSKLAIDIIQFPAEHPRNKLAREECAMQPEIYSELIEQFREHGQLPSDSSLRPELIADKGFNPTAVDNFLSTFRESLEYAGLLEGDALLLEPADRDLSGSGGDMSVMDEAVQQRPSVSRGMPAGQPMRTTAAITIPAHSPADVKDDRLSLDEGQVIIQRPAKLSAGSLIDLESWLELIVRNAKRAVRRTLEGDEIEVGSRDMLLAWAEGVETYTPVFRGKQLEEEGGTTDASTENLQQILAETHDIVRSITAGPNGGMVFTFATTGYYLATGYGMGYSGKGSIGFAEFAAECGFGDIPDLEDKIISTPRDFEGLLFHQ